MTSTSFNAIQTQQRAFQENTSLTLKQGQIFHGSIKKLYPDNLAEIQIGQNKLFAKLETPLKAGDSHFFQVTSINPQAELKVVSSPMSQFVAPSQQLTQLLESMNLPKTTEMQQLLSHFVKEQIPISKETLIQAEVWLKNLPQDVQKQEAFNAIQKMIELKTPFTDEVFKALLFGSKTNGISTSIASVIQQLNNDTTVSPQLKVTLIQQLQNISTPFESEKGGILLARSIEVLMDTNESISNKLQALNVLKGTNVVSKNATIQNWMAQSLKQLATDTSVEVRQEKAGQIMQLISQGISKNMSQISSDVKSWIREQNLLTDSQKSTLQQMITRFETSPPTQQSIEQFTKQLYEQLLKDFSSNTRSQLFLNDINGISAKEHLMSLFQTSNSEKNHLFNIAKIGNESSQPFIQKVMNHIDVEIHSTLDSKAIEHVIKSALKGLGVSYEAALNNKEANIPSIMQTLKPHLLNLLHDPAISPTLKESVDVLLARLNGMQLLSGENGHQHQIVMQLPLQLFGRQMDATLQWNGRMKKDGKIDSDYARILFYLDMEALNETVIDMQVQNRIVTIHLYNNLQNLNKLAEPLKESLKKGLAEKDYLLSGVFFKSFVQNGSVVKNSKDSGENNAHHNGVDIRV